MTLFSDTLLLKHPNRRTIKQIISLTCTDFENVKQILSYSICIRQVPFSGLTIFPVTFAHWCEGSQNYHISHCIPYDISYQIVHIDVFIENIFMMLMGLNWKKKCISQSELKFMVEKSRVDSIKCNNFFNRVHLNCSWN